MKTILCYGDSLTWGANAATNARHGYEDRWPSVIEAGVAGKARVIAEGLGGRTTVFDDFSNAADRNGVRVLPAILASHSPLDLVIIMLGTNDLKPYTCGSAIGAAKGVARLVEVTRTFPYYGGVPAPQVIMVSPPLVSETDHVDLGPMYEGAIAESKKFAGHYSRIAAELGCGFFDAAKVAVTTPIDGIHLDAKNTRAIGEGLLPLVKSTLGL